jgi:chromate transporter
VTLGSLHPPAEPPRASERTPAIGRPSVAEGAIPSVPFRDAFLFWLKLGFINFGGPTGQIAIMHQELVERRRWIGEERFLHALNYCMLLPGPEAQQLAIYVGWLLHRTRGGLVAGLFFILPAFFLMLGLSWLYVAHGSVPAVAAVFHGLRPAVVAIVAAAVIRIGSRALRRRESLAIALAAFVAIFAFEVPFPLIVLGAALLGLAAGRAWPDRSARRDDTPLPDHAPPTLRRTLAVLLAGLAAWWGPLAAVIGWCGTDHVLAREAFFFSKAAMVTFGGAYAVLAYIDQAAVDRYGWLAPGQMLDGLGLAESTPGPLIMVTEFVGFVGAYQNPGGMDPLVAGILGATVTVWATFAPCFLWIFLGAPFVERLRGSAALNAALSGITAAVVGVVLNLAVSFGRETLVGDLFALAVAAVAFGGMWRLRWGILPVVGASAAAGLVRLLLAS